MDKEDLQRNFQGYLNTPVLWHGADVYDLKQCVLKEYGSVLFTGKVSDNFRLGKLVERFVGDQLIHNTSYDILAENVQIQDGKRTIGELDALLMSNAGPIHLEIIYKFYLYDPDDGNDELSHWIGPNRKDSLLQKLDKLKNKQLPLLYHPKTQLLLKELELDIDEIKQQVLFKAQLFLPLNTHGDLFFALNPKCVEGFYLKTEELHKFKSAQFYIPKKINWLMAVDDDIAWMNYDEFRTEVTDWLDKKMAPLCWLNNHGALSKFFVVWW